MIEHRSIPGVVSTSNSKKMKSRPNRRATALLILIVSILFILSGCSQMTEEEETVSTDDTTSSDTTSIDVSVSLPTSGEGQMMTALGTVEDVESVFITVQLESGDTVVIPETELTETPEGSGTWAGTLSELPVYQSLVFEARAYDDEEQMIYSATNTCELSNGASAGIVLEMESIDDGVDPDNPKVASLTVPSEIAALSTNNPLIFEIDHDSTVLYTLEAELGTISSPTSGELNPFFDLEVGYNAPDSAGTDTIRISIWDPEMTDTITTEYAITIVDGEASSGITVLFGPAITAMHFLRTENELQVSCETVPATGLVYNWEGSGSFAAFTSSDNPVIIEDFSDDDNGTVQLKVTDENGIHTAISRTISAGDFPYMVLVSEEPNPVDTVLDIASLLLWQDDNAHPFLTYEDAVDYCENTFEAGEYTDWRLPTRSELKGLYLRRNILVNLLPYSYWTSELSRRDSLQAWYRSFDWGFESIKLRSYYSFVRCVRDWQE